MVQGDSPTRYCYPQSGIEYSEYLLIQRPWVFIWSTSFDSMEFRLLNLPQATIEQGHIKPL